MLGPSLLLPFASPRKAWWLGFERRRLHPLSQPSSPQALVVSPPPQLLDPAPTLIRVDPAPTWIGHFLDRFWSRRAVVAAISVCTCYVPANRVVLGLLGAGWAPHPDYLVVCFFLDLLVFSLHFLESNRMDELGRGSWAWLLLSIESHSSFFCLTSSRN